MLEEIHLTLTHLRTERHLTRGGLIGQGHRGRNRWFRDNWLLGLNAVVLGVRRPSLVVVAGEHRILILVHLLLELANRPHMLQILGCFCVEGILIFLVFEEFIFGRK